MAEERSAVQPQHSAPSAGFSGLLQEASAPLGSSQDRAVQPFPRSPKLQRKAAVDAPPSERQLSKHLEELKVESSRTDAHIESLKKRRADLSRTSEVMKQQVREHFNNMRRVLQQDEQAALDSLELDLRQTRTRLDQVLKNWEQHQDRVSRAILGTRRALSPGAEQDGKARPETISPKIPNAAEREIRLDGERFEKLLKTLSSVSRNLRAQLQRKTLLLDSSPMVIDRQTCHPQVTVTSEGRGLAFSGPAQSAPERPLQFDKVLCALGSSPIAAGRGYWEVDTRCCSAWAVGVAYATLQRKGRDAAAKLGRNRNSWCVELKRGQLSAWHNDRSVACQGAGRGPPGRVGVWVNYDKGQLMFYDADSMAVLQSFSAAVTPVFDRAHHQFTEPLYPALRFLKPTEPQVWPSHLEVCSPGSISSISPHSPL
ncbi:tripartite motif-containing protein 14 [Cololabis saira]|uniref:tripartite motif-containing protein 14 n=1 Tax=Cololabis saira TaxID=129043 RepID=UPI002AD5650A|nr:tripartite motif-containing protein 14 [Cololabis saira]